MNRLSQIGGAGKTVVEGTLNEPATVTVSGQTAQVSSQPGTSEFKFQKEIPVTQGTNNFQITATDGRGNARSQNYSVQVGPAQKTYEYDSNGNLLREKDPVGAVIRSFEWDAADRLKAIVSGSQRIEWTYNSQGQKILETTNGTASKRYLWDGSSLLLERTNTGVITKRLYADGEQRSGGTDAGNYYCTRDHLGSIREVVNQAGIIQARYDYDAYGKRSTLNQSPTYLNGCTFGYTGHLTLPSLTPGQSELVLTHYRAYDPQLGRWLSADPIGESGGMNLYGYVSGDPVNFRDRFGLCPLASPETARQWSSTNTASGDVSLGEAVGFMTGAIAANAVSAAAVVFAPEAFYMLLRNPGLIIAGTAAVDETGVLSTNGFFAGARYTPKVLAQIAQKDAHSFPEAVRAFECQGVVSKITGGDGKIRDMLKIPGSYRGKDGFFEFIKESDGTINHRFFNSNP